MRVRGEKRSITLDIATIKDIEDQYSFIRRLPLLLIGYAVLATKDDRPSVEWTRTRTLLSATVIGG